MKPRFLSNKNSQQQSSSSSSSSDFLDNLGDLLDKQLMVSSSSSSSSEHGRQQTDNNNSDDNNSDDNNNKSTTTNNNIKENDHDHDGWRIIDWKEQFWNQQHPKMMTTMMMNKTKENETNNNRNSKTPSSSPVERVLIRNRLVYFKRDDLLRLSSSSSSSSSSGSNSAPIGISGNKARKMIALNDIIDVVNKQQTVGGLDSDDDGNEIFFPSCVVSYGGPQSNAMLALAAIVHFKNQEALLSLSSSSSSSTDSTTTSTTTSKHNNNNNSRRIDDNDEPPSSTTPTTPIKRFVYYTKKLPRFLKNQPNGNLFRAQILGMELKQLSSEEYRNLFGGEYGGPTEPPMIDPPIRGDSLWVPQGGACGMALRGAWELALEIVEFWSNEGKGRPLTVCIPGGTCSTAALVNAALYEIQKQQQQQQQRHSSSSSSSSNNNNNKKGQQQQQQQQQQSTDTGGKDILDIRVVVIPCVGDEQYAQRQMTSLLRSTWKKEVGDDDDVVTPPLPTVLKPTPDPPRSHYFGQPATTTPSSYYQFAEPHEDILATFREMQEEYGISLDLIYGAPSWTILLRHFRTERRREEEEFSGDDAAAASAGGGAATFDPNAPLAGREIMYVHSGGLEGVNSQLMRYKYKGYIEDVQLPGRR